MLSPSPIIFLSGQSSKPVKGHCSWHKGSLAKVSVEN
jgi:hypothetical protein